MMLDANMELDRLKRLLSNKGYEQSTIEEIAGYAESDLSAAIADVLYSSMQEVIEEAGEIDAYEFLEEMRAMHVGSDFIITTQSGRTDFSEPPFPMLPHLLKGAKTAKDGSQYRVIPMSKEKKKGTRAKNTTLEALKALDQAKIESAQGKQARKHGARSGSRSILEQASMLAGYYASHAPTGGKEERQKKEIATVPEFRTASSKQDPMTNWVIPEKKKDMTTTLRHINADMQNRISEVIRSVINEYEGMY